MARFIVLLAASFCAGIFSTDASHPFQSSSGRIVGGFVVPVEDVPFQVSLSWNGSDHFCGGSLLSKRWVMTAGHCAYPEDTKLKVRVGSSQHASGGQLINVNKIYRHPEYYAVKIDYDFALLELAEEVQFSERCSPAELPSSDDRMEEGTCLQVSGWGSTQNPAESSDVLRALYVPKISQEECARAYSEKNKVTDRMFCAGYLEGGKDNCHGDSGGPLVRGKTLVGLVSWGVGCAEAGHPGVYARVAAVRDWVKEISGL